MYKKIIVIFIAVFLILSSKRQVSAEGQIVTASASFKTQTSEGDVDLRINTLAEFLRKYNSPLADYAHKFVFYADEYNLDYRLVAAISGVESTFGKKIPQGSFNAYGWANGKYYFESWEDSIMIVSKTLREKYYDRGAENIDQIAARYAPPSNSWSWKVKFFMNKIDPVPVKFDL